MLSLVGLTTERHHRLISIPSMLPSFAFLDPDGSTWNPFLLDPESLGGSRSFRLGV